ncbi:MAG: AAA family ATPase, partial [Lentisphaerae bacterium]|nr:AAA family ATPase [Lentisphaerota bacterium]
KTLQELESALHYNVKMFLEKTGCGLEHVTKHTSLCDFSTVLRTAEKKLGKRVATAEKHNLIYENTRMFAAHLGLSPVETRLLTFAVLLSLISNLNNALSETARCINKPMEDFLGDLLDLEPQEIVAALDPSSALMKLGLVSFTWGMGEEIVSMVGDVPRLFTGVHQDADSILEFFCRKSPPADLAISDFPHLEYKTGLMLGYLRSAMESGRSGVNILLYGPPGTGKTQLARAVAASCGAILYEVAVMDSDRDPMREPRRITAYQVSQEMLSSKSGAMVLFDECEDVFQRDAVFFGKTSGGNFEKGFKNRMLETNHVPAIWITNLPESMDHAFLRRYSFVLGVGKPPLHVRSRIIEKYIDTAPVSSEWKGRLARCEMLSPADIEAVACVAAGAAAGGQAGYERAFETLAGERMQAIGRRFEMPPAMDDREKFSVRYLNTSEDPARLALALSDKKSVTMLFHGTPGTGKTAFGKKIAEALEQPLMVRRASEILDKFIGQTEQNIARMFYDAEAEGAVLLLDEADSFLRDRREAQRSWEVTQVNELLTRMEEFKGFFICTTNLPGVIDSAAFRRFSIKVEFDYLTSEQAVEMFRAETQLAGLPSEDEAVIARAEDFIKKLAELTPGDFATVRKKYRLFCLKGGVCELAGMLVDECGAKKGPVKKAVGF